MSETNNPLAPDILTLQALGWILGDEDRAARFLALTGLTPDDLRHRINETAVQIAIIDFLCAHEPDLIACAETLGITPEKLANTRHELEHSPQ